MGLAVGSPLAPSAKPLAHEDAPVAPVESAPGLLEAQPGVDGQVLVHLLVGVEPYLRKAIRRGLPLREGHELAPEAPPLVPGCDGHVAQEHMVLGWPDHQYPEHLPALGQHPNLAGSDEGGVVLEHRRGLLADALNVTCVGRPYQVADRRGVTRFGRSYAPIRHNLPFQRAMCEV